MKKVVEIELKICHRLLNRPLKVLKWHTLNQGNRIKIWL